MGFSVYVKDNKVVIKDIQSLDIVDAVKRLLGAEGQIRQGEEQLKKLTEGIRDLKEAREKFHRVLRNNPDLLHDLKAQDFHLFNQFVEVFQEFKKMVESEK